MITILFPTDFSPVAGNALRFAYQMAEEMGARLVLLHVYHPQALETDWQAHPVLRALEGERRAAALDHFQDYAEALQNHLGQRVPVALRIEIGFAVDGIVQVCEALQPDLVVMGTTGAHNLAEDVFGSTTSSVMQQLTCPVLAVPQAVDYQRIRRIAFATDFREPDTRQAARLAGLARLLRAEVLRVHVVPQDMQPHAVAELAEGHEADWSYGAAPLHVLHGDRVAEALEAFAQAQQIDLLALIPHKRSFWEQWWHPSLTRRMLLHAHTPILAVKP